MDGRVCDVCACTAVHALQYMHELNMKEDTNTDTKMHIYDPSVLLNMPACTDTCTNVHKLVQTHKKDLY